MQGRRSADLGVFTGGRASNNSVAALERSDNVASPEPRFRPALAGLKRGYKIN